MPKRSSLKGFGCLKGQEAIRYRLHVGDVSVDCNRQPVLQGRVWKKMND
ncbi:MAG: hypothetical protein JRJ45_08960 [Deltaproteobacteria bacterium]|nr:hypothetical protein [Deltaproteobacteria bacterium]